MKGKAWKAAQGIKANARLKKAKTRDAIYFILYKGKV